MCFTFSKNEVGETHEEILSLTHRYIYEIIFSYKMDLTIMESDINVVSEISLLPHKPVVQYNRERS